MPVSNPRCIRGLLGDRASGNKLKEWHFPGPIDQVLFAPNRQYVTTGNANGPVYILKLPPEVAGK